MLEDFELRWFGTFAATSSVVLEMEYWQEVLALADTVPVTRNAPLDYNQFIGQQLITRRQRKMAKSVGTIWHHLIKYDPQQPGSYLFDAVAVGAGLDLPPGRARGLCVQTWRGSSYASMLHAFAKQDGG